MYTPWKVDMQRKIVYISLPKVHCQVPCVLSLPGCIYTILFHPPTLTASATPTDPKADPKAACFELVSRTRRCSWRCINARTPVANPRRSLVDSPPVPTRRPNATRERPMVSND